MTAATKKYAAACAFNMEQIYTLPTIESARRQTPEPQVCPSPCRRHGKEGACSGSNSHDCGRPL